MRGRAGRGAAVERVTRTMSLALGVGAVVFGILTLGPFLAQFPATLPAWSIASGVLIFAPILLMAVLSPFAPVRVLRVLAAVSALAHLAALVTFVPLLPGGTMDASFGSSWLFGVTVIPSAAAAVAFRPLVAWGYVVACITALGIDRYVASPEPIPETAFQDALHTFLMVAIFTALASATYRAGRVLDATADAAVAETRAVAASEARGRERARVEALLHDTVLVALLASARGNARAPEQARSALAELERARHDEPEPTVPLDPLALTWRMQSLTTDIAPDARFSHDADPDAPPLPAEAAHAVLEATAEALRNSVLHAGPASRAVHVRAGADGIDVTVLDDGVGFDPASVDPGRLGVSVSILDRVQSVPGGRAAIVSRPGVGTRVSVGWRAAA